MNTMDVSSLVSAEYSEVSSDTPVSKVVAAFDDPDCRGVVVANSDGFEGVVTRRHLARSHQSPEEKAESVAWPVPRIDPHENVREAAQLMLDGDVRLLPVFEEQQLTGVVTADTLLKHVQEYLEAATVADAYSPDLVTLQPEATLGEALPKFREHKITHVPVIEEGSPRGMLSLYDIVDLTTRKVETSQDGSNSGATGNGGTGTSDEYGSHGGHGARDGELERMLDLPVVDMMTSPVRTVEREETLEQAVDQMFEAGASSLVVTDQEGNPSGILTKSDVLDSLTWTAEGNRAIQINGAEYLDDVEYSDIVDMINELERMDGNLDLQDAKVHVNKHQERRRGTPLLFIRVRLSTDRGLITASEEGFGASHALGEVREVLKRRIRDEKTYGKSKKPPDEDFWEKRFGWMLAE